ncbi:MAG TPA: hypothetical protein VFT75_00895 [Nocardioidaceae bacterium]|jgi:hypothetical protein|nr:hypothetical protein [Nocardioidaceae bacterium]
MTEHRSWQARNLVARAATAAGALVVSALVLVPGPAASADSPAGLIGSSGLLDLLTTVQPVISGTGQVTGDNGYLCSSATDAGITSGCPSIGLDSLLGPSAVTLVPQAPSGWTFDGWSGCPDVTAAGSCLVDGSIVGTVTGLVIQPVASFIPLLGGGDGGGGGDAPVPDSQLSGGPRQSGWLRSDHVRFRLTSDQDGASFDCTLDGTTVQCASPWRLRHLAAGTHTVTATASLDGQADPTPARRTFTRPVNDQDLHHSPAWHERAGKRGYFLRSFSQTRRHGATLRTPARHIEKIALVATRAPRFGTVKVYLGKQLLRRVSLSASTLRRRRIIPVARFDHQRRGLVRVVVVSHRKLVRIEGLGLARR